MLKSLFIPLYLSCTYHLNLQYLNYVEFDFINNYINENGKFKKITSY